MPVIRCSLMNLTEGERQLVSKKKCDEIRERKNSCPYIGCPHHPLNKSGEK